MLDWDKKKLISVFQVDPAKGLAEAEVEKRRNQVGSNRISEGGKTSYIAVLLNQFKDFMVLVLLVATLLSAFLGEYTDAIAIMAIVILNAVLGFVQEVRAERSLQALKKLSAPSARVLREGQWRTIQAHGLVPGDIVQLQSGDRIPADLRWLQADQLQVEESALTGESLPVHKHIRPIANTKLPVGDRKNMGFMGTMVVGGRGTGLIVETGMRTEMGKIAHLIETTETMTTPLQRRLEQLGKILILMALLLTATVVLTGIYHGQDMYKMFMAGVSLAVAAIPEGLPAIVTIALALGVGRMVKRKAIVRKLPSVETLGCATVICSDKTGTLTQNRMTVTHLWAGGRLVEVSGQGYQPQGEFHDQQGKITAGRNIDLQKALQIAALCNNAHLYCKTEKGRLLKKKTWMIEGDPTEGALLVVASKAGYSVESLQSDWERIREIPFDSERKMMSVVLKEPQTGKQVLYSKGAPDVLLARCTHQLQNGKKVRLSESMRREILQINQQMAGKALRNLALAYRDMKVGDQPTEEDMVWVGIAGMIDPPRIEVKDAIRQCKKAGIRTVMITGDHQATAEAIAKELGIKRENGLTINGQDLYNMSDDEFLQKVNQVDVFARVSPEHKLKIVKALQKEGHVVAMTGDGVNDAPAMKAADIGIAMGITGTDVTKESSSLVLADDNFTTIVAAIEEGRNIYDNIRKFISYLLASNVGEILVMFFAMLAGLPLPLLPIQILWVNLVTDGLPAMALGVDPAQGNTMGRPPRGSHESIFAQGVGWKILTRGLLIGLCSLLAFWVTYQENPDQLALAQTVAFATLVMCQLIYVFDCRSASTIFGRNPFSNPSLVVAVVSSVILLLIVMYYPPLQPIFHTVSIGMREWVLIIVTSTFPVLVAGLLDQLVLRKKHARA